MKGTLSFAVLGALAALFLYASPAQAGCCDPGDFGCLTDANLCCPCIGNDTAGGAEGTSGIEEEVMESSEAHGAPVASVVKRIYGKSVVVTKHTITYSDGTRSSFTTEAKIKPGSVIGRGMRAKRKK